MNMDFHNSNHQLLMCSGPVVVLRNLQKEIDSEIKKG